MPRGWSLRSRRSAIAELTLPADPERALSIAYAPRHARAALSALWRLDEQLGTIVARTENAVVGQMRLTWWHDALLALGGVRPVDPLLVDLAATSVDPNALLPLIDGWELLLEPLPMSEDALAQFADKRGATLFRIAADLLGSEGERAADAGRAWALLDLAFRISDRTTAERAVALIPDTRARLPRSLAVLAALSRLDRNAGLDRPRRQGSPGRVLRAMIAGLTGR